MGPPQIRDIDPAARYFTSWAVPQADVTKMEEPLPELQPRLDELPQSTMSKRS